MHTVEWRSRAADVDARAWAFAPSVELSPAWLTLNERDLLVRCDYLVVRNGDVPIGVAPFVEVDAASLWHFSPRALLTEYLREVNALPLRAAVEQHLSPRALACLIPGSAASPLAAMPLDCIAEIATAAEQEARARGLATVAFLYLDDRDLPAVAALAQCGYAMATLDAMPEIAIDPEWHDVNDYLHGLRRRSLRAEHKRFIEQGYEVRWHHQLDDRVLDEISELNFQLHARKGNELSREHIRAYFAAISAELQPLLVTARRGEPAEAFALFYRSGDRLTGLESGFDPYSDFQYFNVLFYEPVAYAITHGIARLDFGLGATEAKRMRANRSRTTRAAFRFLDGALADVWPDIAAALSRRYTRCAELGTRS